jgi:hypothetical protein
MKPSATFTFNGDNFGMDVCEELMSRPFSQKGVVHLYAIPKQLPPELVDALNEAIMASTCAEQVWERFYPLFIGEKK